MVNWLSAHCPEHETFEPTCTACAAQPQSCPAHPYTNGTYPGLAWCPDCQKTRPGYEVRDSKVVEVITAEEAVAKYNIPNEQRKRGGRWRIFLRQE